MKKITKKQVVLGVVVGLLLSAIMIITLEQGKPPEDFGKNQETIEYIKDLIGEDVTSVDVIDQNNGAYDIVVTAKSSLIGSGTDWGIAAQKFFNLSKELFTKYKGKVNTLAFDLEAEGQDINGNPENIHWATLMTKGQNVSSVNWENIGEFQYTKNFVELSAYNRQSQEWLDEYIEEYLN